jgi:hypothetical protein
MQSPRSLRRVVMIPALLALSLAGASSAFAAGPTPAAPERTVVVSGSGVLAAHGSGVARLAGSYILAGSMDGGSIRIVGATAWTKIRVTGWSSKTRLADGTLIFRGVHGKFHIAGRTIRTTIESTSMRFVATGHGRAVLRGHGEYWVNGVGPKPWSTPGSEPAF